MAFSIKEAFIAPKDWSLIFKVKIFWDKNGEIGVKNRHFLAFLGNQSLDFSDFWYDTSLIYYFKYGTGSFARRNFLSSEIK